MLLLQKAITVAMVAYFIPQGHKFRLSRQAAQLSFIPQGHKFPVKNTACRSGRLFTIILMK
jgi:hypothetical protein